MTDPLGTAPFQQQLRHELDRIGADDALRDGLAVEGPVTPEQILAAFRATPDGAGSRTFYANLATVLGRGAAMKDP